LSCTAQWACSANLLELPLGVTDHTDGDPPPFFNLLAEARGDDLPTPTASLEDRGSDDVSNGGGKGIAGKKKSSILVNLSYRFPNIEISVTVLNDIIDN
jgi:hypothetical protein